MATASTDVLMGVKLGDYRVEERIGIGGMGIVYRAVHTVMGNDVAIKVLRPDVIADESDLQRFLGEAKAINRVRHPNVISIFGAGDTPDGRKYLVMERLFGHTLERELQLKGRLPTSEVVPILEEVLAALTAVHAAGVVHRDLKPGNVFLAHQTDGRAYVKLVDFGLARHSNETHVSRVAGTPDYISPEHARGRPPGPPADLYAFGVMAFQLLTGQLPYIGKTAVQVMEQHISAPRPRADEIDPNIPVSMSNLILRLMEKDPDRRPSAAQVKVELGAASVELRSATTQAGGYVLPPLGPIPQIVSLTPSPSGDTEPQLQAQQALGSGSVDTPLHPTPAASDTSKSLPAETARDLPRRRLVRVGAALGFLVIVALSAKALNDARPDARPRPEGRKAAPNLPDLESEAEAGAENSPEPSKVAVAVVEPPAPAPSAVEPPDPNPKRDPKRLKWRADTRARLERVQRTSREKRLDASESAAKGLLERLDQVPRSEQRDFEQKVAKLEANVAAAR